MTKENLKEFLKNISSEVSAEDYSQKFGDNYYYFKELSIEGTTDDDWNGGGKYQNRYQIFQLVRFDEKTYEDLEEYDLFVGQSGTRSGSYYTDYYTSYERHILNKVVNHIPEQTIIIPAHDEISYVEDK